MGTLLIVYGIGVAVNAAIYGWLSNHKNMYQPIVGSLFWPLLVPMGIGALAHDAVDYLKSRR